MGPSNTLYRWWITIRSPNVCRIPLGRLEKAGLLINSSLLACWVILGTVLWQVKPFLTYCIYDCHFLFLMKVVIQIDESSDWNSMTVWVGKGSKRGLAPFDLVQWSSMLLLWSCRISDWTSVRTGVKRSLSLVPNVGRGFRRLRPAWESNNRKESENIPRLLPCRADQCYTSELFYNFFQMKSKRVVTKGWQFDFFSTFLAVPSEVVWKPCLWTWCELGAWLVNWCGSLPLVVEWVPLDSRSASSV